LAKYAAARRRISFSCSSSLVRLRSSRSSADSVLVVPGRMPSSVSAIFSRRCGQDSEIPKSFAICDSGTSPLRATATTSRRNSAENGFGMTNILPARTRPSQVRSQPNRRQSHRAVIEQAKGIIMGERRCTAEEAFAILAKMSQDTNRKVRDVATALVTKSHAPE
jgi:hypothetical protein